MSRLQGVNDHDAGLSAKLAFFFTKRKLAQLAGLETAGMLEPAVCIEQPGDVRIHP